MKQQLIRFAAGAALAAGMALAQTQAAPAPAPQAGQGTGPAVKPRAGLRRLVVALNLTGAQKRQAKAIFQDARQQAQPLAAQLKQNRQDLGAAVKANDTTRIQTLAAQQGNLRGQLLAIRSEAMAKFYATLTPDQRARADEIRQRVGQRIERRIRKLEADNG